MYLNDLSTELIRNSITREEYTERGEVGSSENILHLHLPSLNSMGILSDMKRRLEINIDFADEARRFFSIQVLRYLEHRPSKRFSGGPEKDAVHAMIKDAWVELRSSICLSELSRQGRDALYVTVIIVFPSFVADGGSRCVPVDFINGMRLCKHGVTVTSRPTMDL